MFEQIGRMWWDALPRQQTSSHEAVECRIELGIRLAHHRSQQGMRKLAPDRRPDLRHLLGRTEPVETRHQRGVQAGGDRLRRRRNSGGSTSGLAFTFGLQHRLRHLLHEQGNAVGALHDLRHHVRW
jgi:hypothetical protein